MKAVIGDGNIDASVSQNSPCADEFAKFFQKKVNDIRTSTNGSQPPSFTSAPAHCRLSIFNPVDPEEVEKLIRAAPSKQCILDSWPTSF